VLQKAKPKQPELGDLVEITSTNFKMFFFGSKELDHPAIGVIINTEDNWIVDMLEDKLYTVLLITGVEFLLYATEMIVIGRCEDPIY